MERLSRVGLAGLLCLQPVHIQDGCLLCMRGLALLPT